jgi:L-aminoadipate-semialdehyde dehydrogenase
MNDNNINENKQLEINKNELFYQLGIQSVNDGVFHGEWLKTSGKEIQSMTPVDGSLLGSVRSAGAKEYETVIKASEEAFKQWRMVPAPKRGEVMHNLGQELRKYKDPLGTLISLEMGKIKTEGDGEVQEMIDICDFAVGLSRQLYGKTMHSERPWSRMYEQWHPLGIIGLITSFNFPAAVWAWNFAVAGVCGDVTVWKPSSKTPLTAIAVTNIVHRVLQAHGYPGAVASLLVGSGREIGERLVGDGRIPLVSATGSTRMGKRIGEVVGARLGRTILELGGNNAIIISNRSNLKMALHATLFGAVGTAGQRCTSTRRLIIHQSIYEQFVQSLIKAYEQVSIGNPLDSNVLMGPLMDETAVGDMQRAIRQLKEEGGRVLYGGDVLEGPQYPGGNYVTPCIAEAENHFKIVQEETFAPILYVMKYNTLDEAIAMQNGVPQGLSSAIFSNHVQEVEHFLSHNGSDCGIANINTGTSGAEIGGAFGGEKETGGGRESGSDSWKYYMRRQTNTSNWGTEIPLAQGIKFDVPNTGHH